MFFQVTKQKLFVSVIVLLVFFSISLFYYNSSWGVLYINPTICVEDPVDAIGGGCATVVPWSIYITSVLIFSYLFSCIIVHWLKK
jgi:hypothetical protein